MNQKLENEDNHPPSGLISKVKKFFRNPFFIKTQSVSEVTDFLKDAVDLNIIDKEAESIANKAIRLGNTTVKEIMVPKVDMVTFGIDDEINAILEKIIESGHSRYPILGSERDEVSGILLAKDMLPKIYEGNNNFSLSDMLREPNVVPETKKADSFIYKIEERIEEGELNDHQRPHQGMYDDFSFSELQSSIQKHAQGLKVNPESQLKALDLSNQIITLENTKYKSNLYFTFLLLRLWDFFQIYTI